MRVKLTNDAIETYGEQYHDLVFVITHRATKHMPAKEFWERRCPDVYHPGYDTGMMGIPLFDLMEEETKVHMPFSVYSFELQRVE